MDKLTQLAIKYGTDKWGKHHYTPVYYDLFNKRRKDIEKVLEIGVAEGAGLRMYRDFFPNAIIYGAENDPNRVFIDPPIQVFRCDQSSQNDLIRLVHKTGPDLDIVIDDGSHKPEDQILTASTLLPLLNKGLTYIIEDVADRGLSMKFPMLGAEYELEVMDLSMRYDDRLIIIKK